MKKFFQCYMVKTTLLILGFFINTGSIFQLHGQSIATLSVTIRDGSTGSNTPARINLTDSKGHHTPLPDEAVKIMYGRNDRAEGFGYLPDSAFYADGRFSIKLPPGKYNLRISKGNEFLSQYHTLDLTHGNLDTAFVLNRWVNMPEKGWYSADDHIHIRRSPRENPLILRWVAAEDVHVGCMLWMGDFHTSYFSQYAFGKEGRYREGNYLLNTGQEEPRTHEIGHTISLGADSAVRMKNQYYYYDRLADKIHQLNGLFGYAHQGMSFHGYRGMTMDVLNGKLDFLELLQFCVPEGPLATGHYYHFLNLGFKITATAGSDFPWCGVSRYVEGPRKWDSQIGNARFYTYVGEDFSFQKWKEGLDAGNTFVSSGPVIELKVNGQLPGSEINVKPGEEITISATALGHEKQVPLEKLRIIGHGNTLDSVTSKEANQSHEKLSIQKNIKVDQGIWIAAACKAGPVQVAHTTPVYIKVNGEGFHYTEKLEENLDKCASYLNELSYLLDNQDKSGVENEVWRYKPGLTDRIEKTREKIEELRKLAD